MPDPHIETDEEIIEHISKGGCGWWVPYAILAGAGLLCLLKSCEKRAHDRESITPPAVMQTQEYLAYQSQRRIGNNYSIR